MQEVQKRARDDKSPGLVEKIKVKAQSLPVSGEKKPAANDKPPATQNTVKSTVVTSAPKFCTECGSKFAVLGTFAKDV